MRSDVKGTLAWSTVGQMAFMVVQCAVGAFSSAAFHIIGHGMYKAALFLGSGDTVSAGLRSVRRPGGSTPVTTPLRWAATIIAPTVLVGLGMWWITPEVADAGIALVAIFAWLSTAAALYGWLGRSPFRADDHRRLGCCHRRCHGSRRTWPGSGCSSNSSRPPSRTPRPTP